MSSSTTTQDLTGDFLLIPSSFLEDEAFLDATYRAFAAWLDEREESAREPFFPTGQEDRIQRQGPDEQDAVGEKYVLAEEQGVVAQDVAGSPPEREGRKLSRMQEKKKRLDKYNEMGRKAWGPIVKLKVWGERPRGRKEREKEEGGGGVM